MLLPHLFDRTKSILIISTYVYIRLYVYVKGLFHVTTDMISFYESILVTIQIDFRVTRTI